MDKNMKKKIRFIEKKVSNLSHVHLVHILHMAASEVNRDLMLEKDGDVLIRFNLMSEELIDRIHSFIVDCLNETGTAKVLTELNHRNKITQVN